MALSDQLFPEPFTRLLLVEGDDDKAFFLSLAKHLNLNNIIFIYQHAGSEHLDDALIALVNDARFEFGDCPRCRFQHERVQQCMQPDRTSEPEKPTTSTACP